jgi:hypothetical protein
MRDRTHEEIAASAKNMVLWTMFDNMPMSEYYFARDNLQTLITEVRANALDEAEERVKALGCNENCGCSITIPNVIAAIRGEGAE